MSETETKEQKKNVGLISEAEALKLAGEVKDSKVKPEEKPEKKETRGRKSKKVKLDPELSVTTDMCIFVFDVIADRSGDHWKLKKEEAKQLGVCVDKLTVKYADYLMKYQLELFSGFTLLMILYPRFKQDKENVKKSKEPETPKSK